MLQSVKNQVIVITGGSSGYGKAAAKLLAEAGAKVIITGRDEKALQQTAEEIQGIETYRSDATRWEDWQKLFAFVMEVHGRVDVLVNNAGGGFVVAATVDQQVETVDQIIALNLNGVVYGSMTFGKQMRAQGAGPSSTSRPPAPPKPGRGSASMLPPNRAWSACPRGCTRNCDRSACASPR